MANLISALNAKSHNLQSVKFAMTPHSVAMLIRRFPVKSPRTLRTVSCLRLCTTIIHQVLTKNISKIHFLFTFPQNTLQVTSSLCSLLYSPAGITIHRFAYLCTFSSTAMTRKCPNLGQKMGDSRHINQENEIHITELSQSREFFVFFSSFLTFLPLQEHQLISPRLYHGRTKREVCQNLP